GSLEAGRPHVLRAQRYDVPARLARGRAVGQISSPHLLVLESRREPQPPCHLEAMPHSHDRSVPRAEHATLDLILAIRAAPAPEPLLAAHHTRRHEAARALLETLLHVHRRVLVDRRLEARHGRGVAVPPQDAGPAYKETGRELDLRPHRRGDASEAILLRH